MTEEEANPTMKKNASEDDNQASLIQRSQTQKSRSSLNHSDEPEESTN